VRAVLKPLTFSLRCRLCYEIARGMAYLHSLIPSVLHGDLKTLNVMLTSNLEVKLTDFGLSGRVEAGSGLVGNVGENPMWCAPEVLGGGCLTAAADVYAFGVVMWEVMERKEPFSSIEYQRAMGMERLKNDVMKGVRPVVAERVYSAKEKTYIKLMRRCWHKDRMVRPKFTEIVDELCLLCGSAGVDVPPPQVRLFFFFFFFCLFVCFVVVVWFDDILNKIPPQICYWS